jgi:D-alanyl-D-alanine dipeptidase
MRQDKARMAKDLMIIRPEDLIAMDTLAEEIPLRVDIVYAQARHPQNMFKEAIYRPEARLWLHRDFADIVILAARRCYEVYGYVFVLKDGLRTVEAQEKIVNTAIVKANPHWLQEPRLFSPPGKGGHPRGMAIDVILETVGGQKLDMGTEFDYLTTDPNINPAARDFPNISDNAKQNRKILEDTMVLAARDLDKPLLPLPAEWWDFRFPKEILDQYKPLSDYDLPAGMRMTI